MADGIIQLPLDSTGKKLDTSELTVGANTVERQRVVVADPTTAANFQAVNSDGTANVRVGAGAAHVGSVGGATVAATGSITRPANTTAYAAGQVVGTASTDVITVASAGRVNGGSGVILDVVVIDQGGASAAGSFELYLFSAAPTVQVDQAALALVAADLATLVAVVPLLNSYVTNVAATISGSRVYTVSGVNAGFVCGGSSTSLFAVLVTRAAYTPISAEAFTILCKCGQD
jgi:hypothetical protein